MLRMNYALATLRMTHTPLPNNKNIPGKTEPPHRECNKKSVSILFLVFIATNFPTRHGGCPRGRGCCHQPVCCPHWHYPVRPMWWSLLLLSQEEQQMLMVFYIPFSYITIFWTEEQKYIRRLQTEKLKVKTEFFLCNRPTTLLL